MISIMQLTASLAFQTYQYSSKEDRIEILNNIITEYENRYDDLVQTITEEMGAPIWLSEKLKHLPNQKTYMKL